MIKRNTIKRTMCLLAIVAIMASMATAFAADTSVVQPRWSYFSTTTEYIDLDDDGNILWEGTGAAYANIGIGYTKVEVKLQMMTDYGWGVMDSGTDYRSGNFAGYGDTYTEVETNKVYRVKLTAWCYDSNGNELESVGPFYSNYLYT